MEVKPGSCIYVLDDVISDDLCETLRVVIDKTKGYKEEHALRSNVKAECVKISNFENKKFAQIIDDKVHKFVGDICKRILAINPLIMKINGDEGYSFRKIHGSTRLHTDDIFSYKPKKESVQSIDISSIRKLSLIIALNSDYEGGEFYFPNQGIDKIKLKKGQAILFPPHWTHPHGVSKPENNTFRYTINTWLLE